MNGTFRKIMKNKLISIIFTAALLSLAESCFAQGFMNLNFESANVSGYSPPSFSVPITNALPGWSGSYSNSTSGGGFATTQAAYDLMTLGNFIEVIDTNFVYNPLQGNYSAVLFWGGGNGGGPTFYSSTISQTGLVPAGTASLLFDAFAAGAPFIVTLGGETINVTPLQTFSNYTLYGGNVPSIMAGQSETLSFTETADSVNQAGLFELDNIQFSTQSIPEPSTFALAAFGAMLLGLRRRQS